MAEGNLIVRAFAGLWGLLDSVRKVLHLLFLLIFVAAILAAFAPTPSAVPSRAALLLAPQGAVVEQLDGDASARAWGELLGNATRQTLAQDLLDALQLAREDTRIEALVLRLGSMGPAGMSTLQELAGAIEAFKASGKPVIAIGDNLTQGQYYLASHADEIYLHPQGLVFIPGFGRFQTYYREAIDKLQVDWNVFKVGEYKSFVEPYTRNDMSDKARSNNKVWLEALWASYQQDISAARGLDEQVLVRYANRMPDYLAETGGEFAKLALEFGLVDELLTRAEMDARVAEVVGEDAHHRFSRIDAVEYLWSVGGVDRSSASGRDVAVVVASGDILDGNQPPGLIGGDSTAALLRQARHDDSISAVVLRVDSGGGSAFASEVIGEEVRLLRDAGKPVLASMGSVAASGGYWISMDADEVWASPSTITGSIGIGAFFPTFNRSLDKLGVHVDGVGTTALAGEFRPDRPLGSNAREILQLNIEAGYRRFVSKAADAREMTYDSLEELARGRIWLGADAQRLGLVDKLGTLSQAVRSAANLAGISEDYGVRYVERQLSLREALAMELTMGMSRIAARVHRSPAMASGSGLRQAADGVLRQLQQLTRWNDPRGMYYHCLCDIR